MRSLFVVVSLFSVLQAGHVIELTDSEFESVIPSKDRDWFIEVYAPWCGYCQKLEPVWEKVAGLLHNKVNVARMDGIANRVTLNRFSVKSFPFIILIHDNKYVININPRREVDNLVNFALSYWKQQAQLALPPAPTFSERAVAKFETVAIPLNEDLQRIVFGYPEVLKILSGMGFATGYVLGFFIILLSGGLT
eukprot:Lithocolla_globosa_v1_NODE_8725_length_789_cov_3.994550.p1 type:complete len:193 gc:universal NODE_8725_length_789_cov_3.994550:673-95(-)